MDTAPAEPTGFDYSEPAPEDAQAARAAADRIRVRLKRSAEDIVEIGRELIAMKDRLPHGRFTAWCDTEFGLSSVTASRLMNVARVFGDKPFTVKHLAPSVLYELAAPSTPEPVRDEVLRLMEIGEQVDRSTITMLKDMRLTMDQCPNDHSVRMDPPGELTMVKFGALTTPVRRPKELSERERRAKIRARISSVPIPDEIRGSSVAAEQAAKMICDGLLDQLPDLVRLVQEASPLLLRNQFLNRANGMMKIARRTH